MSEQLRSRFVSGNHDERNLETGATRMLHGRNAIGVVGRKRDEIQRSIRRVDSHVETDSHIDTLLFEIGAEIGILQRCGGSVRDLSKDEAPELQDTAPYCKQILAGQVVQPLVAALQSCLLTGDWQRCRT